MSNGRSSEGKPPLNQVQLGPATSQDLLQVAEVFTEAFPESLLHTWGRIPELEMTAEAFRVCLDAEPDAFWVARDGNQVVGYAFTPADLSRLWKAAVLRGHLFRWIWRALSGRYHVGWHPLQVILANKWSFFRSALDQHYNVPARILSIAVRPAFQSRGIASGLMQRGLDYLRRRGAPQVRLEVRPDNAPAVKVYTRLGFEVVGETGDSQGPWLIMVKSFRDERPAGQVARPRLR